MDPGQHRHARKEAVPHLHVLAPYVFLDLEEMVAVEFRPAPPIEGLDRFQEWQPLADEPRSDVLDSCQSRA